MMEMEHINDNTIRVLLKPEDLMARGITFLDLLGSGKELENFFYSILDEVDVDHEFKGNDSITFQVMPKKEGLELFISKNLSFENMNPFEMYGDYFTPEEITKWLKNGDPDRFEDMTQDEIIADFQDQETASIEETNLPVKFDFVYELVSFETMIQLSTEICLDNVRSDLYIMDEHYYLALTFLTEDLTAHQIEDQLATVGEFANESTVTSDYLNEHGKRIMAEYAIETTLKYFS